MALGIGAPLLLLLFGVMQGAAIGGEVAGAWVFVSVHVPQRLAVFACGVPTAGLTGGIFPGSRVAVSVNKIYTPEEVLADKQHGSAYDVAGMGVLGVMIGIYLLRRKQALEPR